MEKYHIKLTNEETALVEVTVLHVGPHLSHDAAHAVYKANRRPILLLVNSICERGAIPEGRLKYWDNPSHQTDGRLKVSRKELFERNGCTGQDIYTHPHFLPYLRYFLFGADLPDPVITKFEKQVGNPSWVTSGDILPIGKCARDLVRQYHLDRVSAPEEFFKLCLDMRLSPSIAASVMRSVKQLRWD